MDEKQYAVHVDGVRLGANYDNLWMCFSWYGDIGFGEYNLYYDGEKWNADSECLDSNEDKSFLKALLNSFADSVEVCE